MNFLGSVIWFVFFGGWLSWLLWLLAAGLACVSIVGIPWARACLNLSILAWEPFGKEAIDRYDLKRTRDLGTSIFGSLGNVVWCLLVGWWLALGHVFSGLACCITIIGIPFGLQHFKMAGLALCPVGKAIVPKELAQAARMRNATDDLDKIRAGAPLLFVEDAPRVDIPTRTVQIPGDNSRGAAPTMMSRQRPFWPVARYEGEAGKIVLVVMLVLALVFTVAHFKGQQNEAPVASASAPLSNTQAPLRYAASPSPQTFPSTQTPAVDSVSGQAALKQAQADIKAANDAINAVWNAGSKEWRQNLLPEQRQWLAKRENDCRMKARDSGNPDATDLKTIRLNCQVQMTVARTSSGPASQ